MERFGDDLVILGVNTDTSKDDYREKAKEAGVTWPNIWQGGQFGAVSRKWGVSSYPTYFLLGRDGVILAEGNFIPGLEEKVEQAVATP